MSEVIERVIVNKEDLEALADSVRAAKNETGAYQWDTLKASAIEIIGSGREDVSVETATYTGLLDDLESAIDALPEAGSGSSGGSVETCTVNISYTTTAYPLFICYTCAIDGTISGIFNDNNLSGASGTLTLTNVICGSAIILSRNSSSVRATAENCLAIGGNGGLIHAFEITAPTGEVATISLSASSEPGDF